MTKLIVRAFGVQCRGVGKGCISPRIVFSNRPDLDQIVPDESIFLIGLIVVLNRLQSSPFLTQLSPDQWTMAGGTNHGRSSRDRHVSGAQVCESTLETRGPSGDPRTTKTTTGRRFLIGYCFSTCLKTVADHFFGTRPSED